MNEQAATIKGDLASLGWSSIVRPMRSCNVPITDARFWTLITMASIFGCNLGDCLSFYINWNHWIGLIPLALSFLVLIIGERRSTQATPMWYWAVVIVLRAAATNLADLATHSLELPYLKVLGCLVFLQLVVLWPLQSRVRPVGADSSARPTANGSYWLSLLTAGTLGTAIGDWVAEELHLGTGYGSLLLTAIFVVVLGLGIRSRWNTKTAYWCAIVAVRAAGTCAGDWLAFREDPGLSNGLNLGLPLSTALTGAVFVVGVVLWKTSSKSSPHQMMASNS